MKMSGGYIFGIGYIFIIIIIITLFGYKRRIQGHFLHFFCFLLPCVRILLPSLASAPSPSSPNSTHHFQHHLPLFFQIAITISFISSLPFVQQHHHRPFFCSVLAVLLQGENYCCSSLRSSSSIIFFICNHHTAYAAFPSSPSASPLVASSSVITAAHLFSSFSSESITTISSTSSCFDHQQRYHLFPSLVFISFVTAPSPSLAALSLLWVLWPYR